MKNIMKKIMVLLIAVVGIIPAMNVFAQSDMKVTDKVHFTAGGRRNTVFKTNKGYAYCVTPKKDGPDKGTVLKYKGKITNGYVIYLLETANTSNYNNYYATQIAIWHYYNNKEVTTMSKDCAVWKKSRTLISNASSKKNYTGIQPTISISGNSGLTLTSNYNYYRSGALTVTMANVTTNATLKLENAPSGARIVNASNTTISSVGNKGTFYVLIPRTSVTKSVNFKVTASTKGKASVVNYYSTGTGKNQDLAVLEKEDKVAVTSKALTVSPVNISCKVANGKYYDKSGKEVDKTTYSIQCETHKCEKVGSVYFGINGTQVSETNFYTQCFPSCGTKNGKYYGKDHKETTKENYYKQCFPSCGIKDGKYYGSNHQETTKEGYYTQCFPSCGTKDGKYYGKDHTEVTKIEFEKQCKTHKCEQVGDSYFGINGKEVSQSEYIKQCFPSCGTKNGKYYGPNRTEVSESEYRKQCFPSCGTKDGKYYDNDGNEVTESEYRKQCLPSCAEKDGKYYDNDGKEITKEQYNIQCVPHKCEPVGNVFFGISGTQVSEEEYRKQCLPSCDVKDGKYYDNDGKEITKEQYDIQCVPHNCEKVGNSYFGNEGKIVTEAEFQAQCIHKCEIYNNQYYGLNGDIVTAETFKEQCEAQVVPVPNTAVGSDFVSIIMGSGMLGAVGGVLSHYRKRKHA